MNHDVIERFSHVFVGLAIRSMQENYGSLSTELVAVIAKSKRTKN